MIVLHHILHPSNDGNQSYQRKYLYDRKSSTNGKSSYYGSSAYDEHPSYIFLSETLDSPLFSPRTRSLWVHLVYELIISKQRHIFQRKQWHSVIWWITTRVGHANDADYAHMRNMRMRMRIENLIHIFHIKREKMSLFKRQWNQKSNDEKCVKYAFLSPFTIK